jgi:hypothetical protein
MLELARERTAGAHPYCVPVEHTREARRILGQDRLLAPEQAVVFAKNREAARVPGDIYMRTYLSLQNYRQNLERLGWPEDELTPPGSDRAFDALVAWGDEQEIARKVKRHHEAGADHPIGPRPTIFDAWRRCSSHRRVKIRPSKSDREVRSAWLPVLSVAPAWRPPPEGCAN